MHRPFRDRGMKKFKSLKWTYFVSNDSSHTTTVSFHGIFLSESKIQVNYLHVWWYIWHWYNQNLKGKNNLKFSIIRINAWNLQQCYFWSCYEVTNYHSQYLRRALIRKMSKPYGKDNGFSNYWVYTLIIHHDNPIPPLPVSNLRPTEQTFPTACGSLHN